MNIKVPETISSLSWQKLSFELINIRSSSMMKAHPYSIIQAIIKGVSRIVDKEYEPQIIFHIKEKNHTFKIRKSTRIPVELFFTNAASEYIKQWQETLASYLDDPDFGRNFDLLHLNEPETRSYEMIAEKTAPAYTEGELCLEFLSPFPFKANQKRQRTNLSKKDFIGSLEKRLSRLFDKKILYNSEYDDFKLLHYYWNYTELKHGSNSQPGQTQYINGCVGKLYIKGVFRDILPFIILGSELHAGAKLSNSQGYYILHEESPGYFADRFPDKKAIITVIHDVIERYDHALEKIPFDEDEYAEELSHQISDNLYLPSPSTAFTIKKKNGHQRMVEKLQLQDLIVQNYLLKTITPIFDKMFEEESIGFRKGISRQKAVRMITTAIKDGFQYVIESDIEDFFPSVDLAKLTDLLNFYLPQNDDCLKNLLLKSIKNGYILDGACHDRVKGLAQGSPLSPILANLFLDSFDEQTHQWPVRMIRYADDFVILARSRDEAENILSKTESFLDTPGLKINKDKTSIKRISDGFQFPGMRFEQEEIVEEPDEVFKQLRKPLYITEPYIFLSLNGEAVDIMRYKKIIETIPIRRISEIMVMEKAVFSTALITKCTEYDIPLTIVLNGGYYVTAKGRLVKKKKKDIDDDAAFII